MSRKLRTVNGHIYLTGFSKGFVVTAYYLDCGHAAWARGKQYRHPKRKLCKTCTAIAENPPTQTYRT